MRQKLNEAQSEKAEANFVLSKSDTVDRTIIEALKRDGEEQKEKVFFQMTSFWFYHMHV